MPKRTRRNTEFGEWVRGSRLVRGQSQEQIAGAAQISQQRWSKIEKGLVPTKQELARICNALGKTEAEADQILGATSPIDQRARILQDEFWKFRQTLVDREGPVHIFVLRESPEQINDFAVKMHCQILLDNSDLHLSILFRRSDARIWGSFRSLARLIDQKWPQLASDKPKDEPSRRITGYYRNPESEEGKWSMPMVLPVILVMDSTGADLYCYGSHKEIYDSYRLSGEKEYVATFRSLVLLPAPENADLFASWIQGSYLDPNLPSELWQRIPWPDPTDLR